MAVGYSTAGGFFPCDPYVVIKNTKPASEQEAKMLIKALNGEPHNITTEFVAKPNKEFKALRKERKADYANFGRLKHLF